MVYQPQTDIVSNYSVFGLQLQLLAQFWPPLEHNGSYQAVVWGVRWPNRAHNAPQPTCLAPTANHDALASAPAAPGHHMATGQGAPPWAAHHSHGNIVGPL